MNPVKFFKDLWNKNLAGKASVVVMSLVVLYFFLDFVDYTVKQIVH